MKILHSIYEAQRLAARSEFWPRIKHPHGLLASFGCLLREILRNVFYGGSDWEFQECAPKWVFGLLRLTGVDYSFMGYYREVGEREKSRKFYRDVSGRWWCETTVSPVNYQAAAEELRALLTKSMGVPRHIFLGGRRLGKTAMLTRHMEELKNTGVKNSSYPGLIVIDYLHRAKP